MSHNWEASEEATGLAALRAIRDGQAAQIPLAGSLAFTLVEAKAGFVAYEMKPDATQVNSGGIVHGGVLGLVMDQGIGDAVRTLLPDGVRYVTLDLFVSYIRPAQPGDVLRCEAWVTHKGRRTARSASKVIRGEKVLAECFATLFIDDH